MWVKKTLSYQRKGWTISKNTVIERIRGVYKRSRANLNGKSNPYIIDHFAGIHSPLSVPTWYKKKF